MQRFHRLFILIIFFGLLITFSRSAYLSLLFFPLRYYRNDIRRILSLSSTKFRYYCLPYDSNLAIAYIVHLFILIRFQATIPYLSFLNYFHPSSFDFANSFT